MGNVTNSEGYTDFTAFKAMQAVDGADTKAYHVVKTMMQVARLAGFKLVSNVKLQDRDGRILDTNSIIKRHEAHVKSMQLWKDSPSE